MLIGRTIQISVALGLVTMALPLAELVRHPLEMGMAVEYGQIYKSIDVFAGPGYIKNFPMVKELGWMIQRATLDESIELTAGFGGLFFYLYPEVGNQSSRIQLAAANLAQITGAYNFGGVENPAAKVTVGYQPYKYNADAKNLGEYLFRSTLYPNTTINGSWEAITGATPKITGVVLQKNMLDNRWKNDIILSVSTDWPIYDLSLAYVTSIKLFDFLELGAGANFFHLIPARPSVTTPKTDYNRYFKYQGEYYYANSAYYKNIAEQIKPKGPGDLASINDSISYRAKQALVDSLIAIPDSMPSHLSYSYYSVQGVALMGRFSLDFKPFFGDRLDLKIYGEASLLGVKDYPIFYENPLERLPIMLGIGVPTFGILDELHIEGEYWKSHYIGNYANIIVGNYSVAGPLPDFKAQGDLFGMPATKAYTRDDWKWSVFAKKSLGKNFSAFGQVARDHLRPVYLTSDLMVNPIPSDVFLDNRGWYYALRIQMGI